jgi:hypothetical protein
MMTQDHRRFRFLPNHRLTKRRGWFFRHCERSEAIRTLRDAPGLLRRMRASQ